MCHEVYVIRTICGSWISLSIMWPLRIELNYLCLLIHHQPREDSLTFWYPGCPLLGWSQGLIKAKAAAGKCRLLHPEWPALLTGPMGCGFFGVYIWAGVSSSKLRDPALSTPFCLSPQAQRFVLAQTLGRCTVWNELTLGPALLTLGLQSVLSSILATSTRSPTLPHELLE